MIDNKPFTPEEFEACKLIVRTKHTDDESMMAIASWSYPQYLLSRWTIKKSGSNWPGVCSVDPDHTVTIYWNSSKVTEDAKSGDILETSCEGDGDTECKECLGMKKFFYIDEYTLCGEFEELIKGENK